VGLLGDGRGAVSVQADLFGEVEAAEAAVVERESPAIWGVVRLVEEDTAPRHDPYELVVWPALAVDRPWGEVLLARWLGRDTGYRAFRCVLCRRAVVVSVAEWQADRAQLVACAYAACGGWVQRDSEPVSPEWETPADEEER
jgi:hypothetical protein